MIDKWSQCPATCPSCEQQCGHPYTRHRWHVCGQMHRWPNAADTETPQEAMERAFRDGLPAARIAIQAAIDEEKARGQN